MQLSLVDAAANLREAARMLDDKQGQIDKLSNQMQQLEIDVTDLRKKLNEAKSVMVTTALSDSVSIL